MVGMHRLISCFCHGFNHLVDDKPKARSTLNRMHTPCYLRPASLTTPTQSSHIHAVKEEEEAAQKKEPSAAHTPCTHRIT